MFLGINVNCPVRQILLSYRSLTQRRRVLKSKFQLKQCCILILGAFLGFAPLWVRHIQQVGGHGIYATPDSLLFLGVTLLVSLLGCYLIPDGCVGRCPTPVVGSRGLEIKPRGLFWVKVLAVVSNRTGTSSSYRIRTKALGFGVGLLAIVYVLYLVNQHILHAFLSSADEHSCYFLAECLRKGKLYVETPPLADFFKVVHVGMKGGKWFSVYPPGWPLLWAVGLHFNIVEWLNPVMSALAVFFFYLSGKKLFGRGGAILGLILMCVSPFFIFTAASYFSHATCLLCISVFLYAFMRWREAYAGGRDPVGWAALCAFAVGYGLMTRYLTMAAVAGPFLLYHYLTIFLEWRGGGRGARGLPFSFKVPRLRKSDWIVLGIIGLFMAVILWQNYLVTGKPFKAPNKYDKSWERLGFRRDYTIIDASFYLVSRIFYLMDWFAPAIVGAYLFLLCNLRGLKGSPTSEVNLAQAQNSRGFISGMQGRTSGVDSGRSEMLRNLFRLTPVFIAFAYFFYYSWGGNQWGPRYLWEGLPFLCLAVADWMAHLWRERGIRVRKFLLVFVIASLASSAVLFVKHAEFTEEASRQRRALYDYSEQAIRGPAIVFMHGFIGDRLVMAEEDTVRNSPFLDGRILYAHDLGDRNKELMDAYPGRECFVGAYDRAGKEPRVTAIEKAV